MQIAVYRSKQVENLVTRGESRSPFSRAAYSVRVGPSQLKLAQEVILYEHVRTKGKPEGLEDG